MWLRLKPGPLVLLDQSVDGFHSLNWELILGLILSLVYLLQTSWFTQLGGLRGVEALLKSWMDRGAGTL